MDICLSRDLTSVELLQRTLRELSGKLTRRGMMGQVEIWIRRTNHES